MNGDVRISGEYPQQLCNSVENSSSNSSYQNHVNLQYNKMKTANSQMSPNHMVASNHQASAGSPQQHKTAAAFFAKKKKSGLQLPPSTNQLASPTRHNDAVQNGGSHSQSMVGQIGRQTAYGSILSHCPPIPPPPVLKRMLEGKEAGSGAGQSAMGKVRVYLRVLTKGEPCETITSNQFQMDKKKKQVTLLGPDRTALLGPADRNSTATLAVTETKGSSDPKPGQQKDQEAGKGLDIVLAPRMFAFDGVFTDEDPQLEMCTSSLPECVQALLSGTDSTLFSFGHCSSGKRYTMVGQDDSNLSVGIIPTAIGWIYRCLRQLKDKPTSVRLGVKISALEIAGPREEPRDLLAHLRDTENQEREVKLTSASTSLSQSLTQLRAPTIERAGQILDFILSSRHDEIQGGSHLMVSVHMYQLHQNSDQILGKSQLNLIDFGNCERNLTRGGCITQAGLGHVILGILNGQKHLPFRESKVTSLLRECLGPVRSLVCMVAHVTPSPAHYSETLHTVQLASRLHRIRRKKKTGGSSGGSGSGSSEENRRLTRLARIPGHSSSDMTTSTDPSSSEQSADTVIYLGPRDDEGTDAESPPVYLPTLNSGDHRGLMSCVLRGSSAELPLAKYRSLDRKTNSSSSPRYSSISSSQSPGSSQAHTPVPPPTPLKGGSTSQLSTPVRRPPSTGSGGTGGRRCGSLPRNTTGKMPLYGKVAGYKQPSLNSSGKSDLHSGGGSKHEIWIDSKPDCDQDVIQIQYNETQCIYGYGYMDEHKKRMIQNWVEGQTHTLEMGPPSHLTGKDSLAWLEAHSKQQKAIREQNEFKILTQFKVAESSTSSTPSVSQVDEDLEERIPSEVNQNNLKIRQSPSHRWTRGDPMQPETHSSSSTFKPRLSLAGSVHPQPDSSPVHSLHNHISHTQHQRIDAINQHHQVQIQAADEKSQKPVLEALPGQRQPGGLNQSAVCDDVISEGSRESRTSDRGTSTSDAPDTGEFKTLYPRSPKRNMDQDPYRAQRKLPLKRESMNDEGTKTLDELFSHCEQLVETLSQASEELKQQCQGSNPSAPSSPIKTTPSSRDELQHLTVYDQPEDLEDFSVPCNGGSHRMRSYAEGELYPLSEGSEGSIEVADRSCQVSESQILSALADVSQPPPASWQQQPPASWQASSPKHLPTVAVVTSTNKQSHLGSIDIPSCPKTSSKNAPSSQDSSAVKKVDAAIGHDNDEINEGVNASKAMIGTGLELLDLCNDDVDEDSLQRRLAENRRLKKQLDILDLQDVPDTGEEGSSTRFDQLAKLHELYQSVSSINAKCQTRLTNENQRVDGSQPLHTGSLSILPLYSEEDSSVCSSLSEDLNSLCSEPAWLNSALLQHHHQQTSLSALCSAQSEADHNYINDKNSTLSLNFLDFNTFTKGINTVSLSSLHGVGGTTPSPPPPTNSTPNKITPSTSSVSDNNNGGGESNIPRDSGGIMELNVASMAIVSRCDSPILEGIDSELAKYAKLRNLHQAYNPRKSKVIRPTQNCDINEQLTSLRNTDGRVAEPLANLRHPDGSSNPDLNQHASSLHPELRQRSDLKMNFPMTSGTETSQSLPRTQRLISQLKSSAGTSHQVTSRASHQVTAGNSHQEKADTKDLPKPGGNQQVPEHLDPANRSPGTGRSSSGSDGEELILSRLDASAGLKCTGSGLDSAVGGTLGNNIYIRDRSGAGSNTPRLEHRRTHHEPITNNKKEPSNNHQQLQPEKSSESTKQKDKKEEKSSKTPRFSRLFGGSKKSEEKRCKSGRHSKHKQEQRLSKDSKTKFPAHKSCDALLSDNPIATVKQSSSSKSSKASKMESKNVKGTLFSEPCFENNTKRKSRSIFKGLRKATGGSKSASGVRLDPSSKDSRLQEVNYPSGRSHDVSGRSHNVSGRSFSHTNGERGGKSSEDGENSGYDSGVEVKTRVWGKGATDTSLRIYRTDRKHCKSSGYESIGVESERDSLDSCQGTLNPSTSSPSSSSSNRLYATSSRVEAVIKAGSRVDAVIKAGRTGDRMSPVSILDYDEGYIHKMDAHWRNQEYQRLKKEQETLKTELHDAKTRINVDSARWSYDLHTADSTGLNHLDPDYLEALQKETSILGKRVAACQARTLVSTCFQGPAASQVDGYTGCTAECSPSWNDNDASLC